MHFYPRSPCGERPILGNPCAGCPAISIHALLAESDKRAVRGTMRAIISIHALLAESDNSRQYLRLKNSISIHALLAESDHPAVPGLEAGRYFYPRSPCGERRPLCTSLFLAQIFLSTLSLRRATNIRDTKYPTQTFLSTLSLRRATCR